MDGMSKIMKIVTYVSMAIGFVFGTMLVPEIALADGTTYTPNPTSFDDTTWEIATPGYDCPDFITFVYPPEPNTSFASAVCNGDNQDGQTLTDYNVESVAGTFNDYNSVNEGYTFPNDDAPYGTWRFLTVAAADESCSSYDACLAVAVAQDTVTFEPGHNDGPGSTTPDISITPFDTGTTTCSVDGTTTTCTTVFEPHHNDFTIANVAIVSAVWIGIFLLTAGVVYMFTV